MPPHAPATPPRTHAAPRTERGSIIVYLVVGLVAFGVLAMAGLTRFGATVGSVLAPNCASAARSMAESGVRYAMARMRACANETDLTAAIDAMNGTTYYLTASDTKSPSFTLNIGYDSSSATATVTSTGKGCTLITPVSSAQSASVNLPTIGAGHISPGTSLSFTNDMDGFFATDGFESKSGVTIDSVAKTISLGSDLKENSASVWYTGTNDVCYAGNCTLGSGLCAYWEFEFNRTSEGDGYVWTIMSGENNNKKSNGGDTAMGELMGYGGLGPSGLGIQPPKLGVEFDIYENSDCPTSSCGVGSRCDDSARDHIAYVFWGTETGDGCSATYDDNRHGAGAGSTAQPQNPKDTDNAGTGTDGYYYNSSVFAGNSWMQDGGKFYFRYELDRATTPDATGQYCYRIRSWVKTSTSSSLKNCSATYTGTPEMTKTFTLDKAVHKKLDKVFFGWTEGTGAETQLVTLSKFNLDFKSAPSVPVAPPDYAAAWTFYETSGSTAHNLTEADNGTLKGIYSWGTPGRDCALPGVSCPNSGYVSFDGGTGRMEVADSANLDLTDAGTIACWVYIGNAENGDGLVHKGTYSTPWYNDEDYSLHFINSRKVRLTITNAAGTRLSVDSSSLSTGRWYHVAATWDASKLNIYINGSVSATQANTVGAARSIAPILVAGAQREALSQFRGYMDEIYLYKRALSAAEITNMALGHP